MGPLQASQKPVIGTFGTANRSLYRDCQEPIEIEWRQNDERPAQVPPTPHYNGYGRGHPKKSPFPAYVY